MKGKTFTPMGALHPALFFAGVYIVALLFSIFICSTIFYSCNTSTAEVISKEEKKSQSTPATQNGNTVAALR